MKSLVLALLVLGFVQTTHASTVAKSNGEIAAKILVTLVQSGVPLTSIDDDHFGLILTRVACQVVSTGPYSAQCSVMAKSKEGKLVPVSLPSDGVEDLMATLVEAGASKTCTPVGCRLDAVWVACEYPYFEPNGHTVCHIKQ